MTSSRPAASADSRIAGLSLRQCEQLQAAARAIRDGRPGIAEQMLGELHDEAPTQPEVLRLRGVAQLRSGRFDAAVASLRLALAHRPDDAETLNDLASVLASGGDLSAALDTWRRACAAAPEFAVAWFNLGRNLQQQGESELAVGALRRAGELAPELLSAQILAGDALVHLGRFDQAATHYRRALAHHQACGDAWRGLANIKTLPLADTDIATLSSQLERDDIAENDRIAMGFALGKALEDHARYPDAFQALAEANARMRSASAWRADLFSAHVTRMIHAARELPPAVDPALGQEVIFIVGLPRSGSTLFEQILAAHPEVEGASELGDLDQVLTEESRRRRQPFLAWAGIASAQDWQRLGRCYLERTARWRTQRPRHTDKRPENWLYTGVLGAMLPGARVVDARRDALEAGWSCFKQQFYRQPHFACDLADIAAYTHDYERAMTAWQRAEPTRVRTQRYEALLDEPEAQIHALLTFCKLPFDPACLDYHQTRRSVRTASAAQVRQPLRRDTARAACYGALLDPLRMGLERPAND